MPEDFDLKEIEKKMGNGIEKKEPLMRCGHPAETEHSVYQSLIENVFSPGIGLLLGQCDVCGKIVGGAKVRHALPKEALITIPKGLA